MRVLFLSTQVPVPLSSGYAIRSMSLLRALAELGHETDLVTYASETVADLHLLKPVCRSVAVQMRPMANLSRPGAYLGRVAALFRGVPFALERFASHEMRARIEQALVLGVYDFILADSVFATANLPASSVPLVLNCHNVEWVIFQRYAELATNPVKRAYARLEAQRLCAAEGEACLRSDVALACSSVDAGLLRQICPGAAVIVVPNTIDLDAFRAVKPAGEDEPPTVLFQGVMDWYPNRDAVEFFIAEIWPVVRAAVPEARFVVAGRNPPARWLQQWGGDSGIHITGSVPSLAPYISKASVVAVPLRIGSGTRIKILEAAAAAKLVVSTSVGAEGLEFRPESEILLADTPAEFAARTIQALRDAGLRARLGAAARSRVQALYSQDCVTAALAQALRQLPQPSVTKEAQAK